MTRPPLLPWFRRPAPPTRRPLQRLAPPFPPPPDLVADLAGETLREEASRLASIAERRVDPAGPHIQLTDPAGCTACAQRPCTFLCPAGVFDWHPRGPQAPPITIRHELCVECGACFVFCPGDSIDFHYPRGGYGIFHRYG